MPYLYQNSNHLAQKYKKSSSIDIFQMEKGMICHGSFTRLFHLKQFEKALY